MSANAKALFSFFFFTAARGRLSTATIWPTGWSACWGCRFRDAHHITGIVGLALAEQNAADLPDLTLSRCNPLMVTSRRTSLTFLGVGKILSSRCLYGGNRTCPNVRAQVARWKGIIG